ncbi:MAG: CHC2 zinc finger domain-containing protein [bacterium]
MTQIEFNNLVEEIKAKIDIAQIIGECISLDRNNKALCPFHEEKTPSFSVNIAGQYFHCFGCGKGGDVFTFLGLYDKKPFMEVFSELAQKAGVPLSTLSPEDKQCLNDNRVKENILKETALFYHHNLTSEARDYLTNDRGLNNETISQFQIGYAGGGLRDHLINKCSFPIYLCLKAGVLKKSEDGVIKDYFYKRIIFPNLKRGRIVHLSGRCLDNQEPKYLHLSGSINYLYNEDALLNKMVIIVEGILDCLSAIQSGYPAVALSGSSNFKPEYLSKFSHCETIYVCLDGDEAGIKGTIKAGELIGERAKVIQLPQGDDLNDYLKGHNKEDFDSLISSAKDIIQYNLSFISEDISKIELPKKLEPIINSLAEMEKVKAEAYLSYEIKSRFKLKKEDIDGYRDSINKLRRQKVEISNTQKDNADITPEYSILFDGLVDLVEHNGLPVFLIKEGGNLSIQTQVEREGKIYIPPQREQIPWLLPRAEEVLNLYELQKVISPEESDSVLYDDLLTYHKSISEFPDEAHYELIVAWVIHTYLIEAFQYSPIICLFAVPERGKSRTGKGMIYVSYRGIHVESLRDAYLVRVAHNLRASIFFDVKNIWRKAEKNQSEDILLCRFEKGALVPRVLYPEKGAFKDTVYYSIFGPTIIGTNEAIHKILETRAISINMPETSRQFENDVTPELALPLKERLVVFRARHLNESFPNIPKPARSRLGDILKPIQQIIRLVKPEREPYFLRLVRELESARSVDKMDTIEAKVLMTLINLSDRVEKGTLPIKLITDTFNEDLPEKFTVTYQRVGRLLASMGFKKARGSDGASLIYWDDESIERMKERYGLKQTSGMSESSDNAEPLFNNDITEDTDVFS